MPLPLHNQVAVITGAGRGVGRALALRLAGAGARVALCARTADDLAETAEAVRIAGGEALAVGADVGDKQQVAALVDAVRARWGAPDILVNNAGVGWFKPFLDHTLDELDQIIDTNLKGTMYCCAAVLPDMLARGAGQILTLGSDLARRPLAGMAPYVASKHGVLGFCASLAREVKNRGVKVMTLNTGIVDTQFGGGEVGRDAGWALRPENVAATALTMLTSDTFVMMDEVTLHPLHQDF